MSDIFLIQPPIRDFYLTSKRTIPYGLAAVAASLIAHGFSVEIFDALATSKSKIILLPDEMTYLQEYYGKSDISPFGLFHSFKHFGYSFEYIGKKAKESGAFLVGISSLFTAYSDEAIQTAQAVKKFHPNCKIVMGGHHPTVMPEKVMECKPVDFIIRGEGEVAMPLLAEQVAGRRSQIEYLTSIPGLVFRKEDGTLHINEPAAMDNPDDYPLPAIQLINHSFYQRKKRGSAVIVASRGCPMKCSYCCVGSSGLKYRRRSVKSVMNEIERAVMQYDARFIDFEDENLSLNREWFLNLLHKIIELSESLPPSDAEIELRAMNGLFPPSLDEEIISLMKVAGFKTLNLSVGSVSQEQLKRFNRPDIRISLEKAVMLAEKYELEAVCYIIIGAPFQNAEVSIDDLLYLFKKNLLAGVSVFYPAPGSPDYNLCEELGILPEKFSLMRSACIPISHTTTRIETVTLMRLGRIMNFMKSLAKEELHGLSSKESELQALHDDRRAIGKKLLKLFLYDGKIRGITHEGEVYEHKVSTDVIQRLTERFNLSI